MCSIYMIENMSTGIVYVGSTMKDISERWKKHVSNHKTKAKFNKPLYQAMRKDGVDSFNIRLIEECDEIDRWEREKYFINYYWYHSYNVKRI